MQVRDRVKQTAIYVSASSFNLAGGTAEEGHVTFATAYSFASFSEESWDDIPVLIERSNGEWQIMVAKLNFDTSPSLATLSDAVFYSSSTGAALAFTASEVVTITQAESAYLFSGIAVQILAPPVGGQHGDGGGHFPYLGLNNEGLLAAGQNAHARDPGAVAIGHFAVALPKGALSAGYQAFNSGSPFAAVLGGNKAIPWRPGEMTTGCTNATLAAGSLYQTVALTIYNGETADATPVQLGYNTEDGAVVDGHSMFVNSGTLTLEGILTAVEVSTGARKVWRVEVVAETTMDYVTTSIISQTFTELAESAGATAWSAQFTTDNPNNGLYLEVTGEAAKNIAWMGSFTQHFHGIDQ